jgi:CMP-N-acetylneuraminic acid synthetase
MIDNVKIIIPARKNSKGLPFKNRKLYDYTIKSIPEEYRNKIIFNTDDEFLISKCINDNIKYYVRPEELGSDFASTKSVILDMFYKNEFKYEEIIIMLYLTYPERTFEEIIKAYNFFIEKKAKSLLCRKEINSTHPYLYMIDIGDNKGVQIKKHNLYRRQDYPKVFEISHFISIFNINELLNLNENLYNKDTIFYNIGNKIDVDEQKDLNKLII